MFCEEKKCSLGFPLASGWIHTVMTHMSLFGELLFFVGKFLSLLTIKLYLCVHFIVAHHCSSRRWMEEVGLVGGCRGGPVGSLQSLLLAPAPPLAKEEPLVDGYKREKREGWKGSENLYRIRVSVRQSSSKKPLRYCEFTRYFKESKVTLQKQLKKTF